MAKQNADKIIKTKNNTDILLKTEKAAIEFAEPILFKAYRKTMIKKRGHIPRILVEEFGKSMDHLKRVTMEMCF